MSENIAAERRFQAQVHAQQIEMLFRQMPLSQVTSVLVATLLAGFLWHLAPQPLLPGWWAAIVGMAVGMRLALVSAYRRRAADSRVAWHALAVGASLLSGIAWGMAGWLFFSPANAVALTFLTIILAGMCTGVIASQSSFPPAQFAYAIPTMVPIALRYLAEGGDMRMLGVMCLFHLVAVLVFARQISATLVESIGLRLEKEELAQKLHQEKAAVELARARAESANQAKSKLLAAASHDLRQPLQAVNLFIEALRNETQPSRAATLLSDLALSAQALEELLNELLDLSKLEAGLFKAHIGSVSLRALFEALERELRPLAEEKGLELGFVATRLAVTSDPKMLARILRNVITNAIRHTRQGAVLVGCRRKGEHLAIAVCDTGPGIAAEHHQAIFGEFHQLDNPERDRRKGLGLGLSIVAGLCRILDHRLELKSTVGRGSTFLIHAPHAAAGAEQAPGLEEAAICLRGFAVLVIDDDPAICQAMSVVLENWGCRVLTFASAAEALARLGEEDFSPDAMIADYRLRENCSGSEAIAAVRRALGRPLPAAILTGDTAPERLREAAASGFLLLHKPVKPARLRAALVNWRKGGAATG